MEFSREHRELQQHAYAFAQSVAPAVKWHDRQRAFPRNVIERMAGEGFFGICLPKQHGGMGMDYIALGIVAEALEFADSSLRETLAVHLGLHTLPVLQWGSETQQRHWLPSLAKGKSLAW